MMNNKSDSYYASGIDHKSLAALNLTTYMFTHLEITTWYPTDPIYRRDLLLVIIAIPSPIKL